MRSMKNTAAKPSSLPALCRLWRTFAPFVAGMGDMHYATFIRYNIIGAVLWVLSFSYAGYFFANIPVVKNNLGLVMAAIIVISILPAVVEVIRAKLNAKK